MPLVNRVRLISSWEALNDLTVVFVSLIQGIDLS